jgi:carbon starvation protein
MGKARYCWTTLLPMTFLTVATYTAGWMKIFSPRAAGFVPAIHKLEGKIAAGLDGPALAAAKTSLFNARVDVVVAATLLVFVTLIVLGTAYECWLLLTRRKPSVLRESAYEVQAEAEAV